MENRKTGFHIENEIVNNGEVFFLARSSRTAAPAVLAVVVVVLLAAGIFATPLKTVLLGTGKSGQNAAAGVQPGVPGTHPAVGAGALNSRQAAAPAKVDAQQQAEWNQLYQQGYQYYNDEEYPKAIDLEDQVIRDDPANYPAYTIAGIALCYYGYFDGGSGKNQDFQAGMQDIDKALSLQPDYTLALFNKALAYELYGTSENGYYDTALYWYDRTIAVDPQSVWSYYGKAAIYGRRGDVADTCKYLQQAIDLNPDVKQDARQEKDFDNVRSSAEFQGLVNG
jgi:tetratricopeptide (TPR) repeat protein